MRPQMSAPDCSPQHLQHLAQERSAQELQQGRSLVSIPTAAPWMTEPRRKPALFPPRDAQPRSEPIVHSYRGTRRVGHPRTGTAPHLELGPTRPRHNRPERQTPYQGSGETWLFPARCQGGRKNGKPRGYRTPNPASTRHAPGEPETSHRGRDLTKSADSIGYDEFSDLAKLRGFSE